MSAVYLHNSIYTREPLNGRPIRPPHSRTQSAVSTVTVQTNSTFHSHPTEPLLVPRSSKETYYDNSAGNSRAEFASPSVPSQSWASPRLAEVNRFVESEKPIYRKSGRPQASKRWRWLQLGLEAVMGGWAIYNASRYFLAFTLFESDVGQMVSLALGVSSSLSFAFLAASLFFAWVQPRLIFHGVSYRATMAIYWLLTYASLLFLFAPAVINFAMLFAWKNSDDLQLRMKYRCYVDIDVIWSRRDRLCRGEASTWGFWVVLSTLRLLITALVIAVYHFVLIKRRNMTPIKPKRLHNKHRHKHSDASAYQHSLVASHTGSGTPFPRTSASQSNLDPRHLSEASLVSSRTGLSPRVVRLSQSSGLSSTEGRTVISSQFHSLHSLHHPTIPLSSVPEQDRESGDFGRFSDRFSSLVSQIHRETDDALEFAQSDQASSRHTVDVESPRIQTASPERLSWTSEDEYEEEQVRSQLGQGSGTWQSPPGTYNDGLNENEDDEDDFYGAGSRPSPVISSNEFGQPYPADEQIAMLNGFIRRMPTIESVGSREMGSSIAASSLLARDGDSHRHSFQTNRSSFSRPPTRNTLLSMLSSEGAIGLGLSTPTSEPSSRTNSLTVQVERLAALGFLTGNLTTSSNANSLSNNNNGTTSPTGWPEGVQDISEIGELIDTVQSVKKVPPPHSPSDLNLPALVGHPDGDSRLYSTGGSRNTSTSYHTATTGSSNTGMVVKADEEEVHGVVPQGPPTFF